MDGEHLHTWVSAQVVMLAPIGSIHPDCRAPAFRRDVRMNIRLPGRDSNSDRRLQRPLSCQIGRPGIGTQDPT